MSETETINATPTWEATVRMLMVVLENGTPEGKAMAREEIIRLAKSVDEQQGSVDKG